jgi:basic membrane lipoprotein Med (substrate-binding protein (PBP1-ABC) superfamily)
MTQVAQSVIDGNFKPGFVRQGIAEGMMAVAPFGPSVPAETRKLVNDAVASLAKGFNPFTGPVKDNKGVIRIPAGETWGGDKMGNFDWLVEGAIGQAK